MQDLRIVVTAARKGTQLEAALARRGADVVLAPTTGGDLPVADAELEAATRQVIDLQPEWFAASTGVGMRLWAEAARRSGARDAFLDVLTNTNVVVRGAKARGAVQAMGIETMWQSDRETESDVAAWLAEHVRPGEVVVTQLSGTPGTAFDDLGRSGVRVVPVAPYRRAPVADEGPARQMLTDLVAGHLDVVTFTSPAGVHGLVDIARDMGEWDRVRAALADARPATAVIGVVTAAACERHGIPIAVMPERFRSGALVNAIEAWADEMHVTEPSSSTQGANDGRDEGPDDSRNEGRDGGAGTTGRVADTSDPRQ